MFGWYRRIGCLHRQVSFAKEPCKKQEFFVNTHAHTHTHTHTYTHTHTHTHTHIRTHMMQVREPRCSRWPCTTGTASCTCRYTCACANACARTCMCVQGEGFCLNKCVFLFQWWCGWSPVPSLRWCTLPLTCTNTTIERQCVRHMATPPTQCMLDPLCLLLLLHQQRCILQHTLQYVAGRHPSRPSPFAQACVECSFSTHQPRECDPPKHQDYFFAWKELSVEKWKGGERSRWIDRCVGRYILDK